MLSDRVSELIKSAWALRESEQWDRMLALATEARTLSEQEGFANGVPRALAIQAFVHYIRSDFESAVGECIEALRLSSGDDEAESRARSVLALVHWTLGNYEEALRNSDRSIQLLERMDERVSRAFAFAVKGGILLSLGQLDEALSWHQRSVESFNSLEDEVSGRARALSGLGLTYLAQKRYDQALPPLLEALELARRAHNRITTARTLNDLGEAFEALENDEQALLYHTEALEIRQKEGYRQSLTTSLLALGRIQGRKGEYARALTLLSEGLVIARELGMRPRMAQCHHALANVFQHMGHLSPALEHFMDWERIKSDLAVDQTALRYKAIALEAQLESLQHHAELENLASLGGLVAGIAHEINSPLGAIQSAANVAILAGEKLAAGPDNKAIEALLTNARLITDATRRISNLVQRLKVLAGVDQARYGKVDIPQALDDAVALLKPEFEDRVEVTVDAGKVPVIYAYPADLHQLFLNLLRNAIQAIDGAGKVRITATADSAWIRIAFIDSGRGIPPELFSSLFTPGFSSGSGRVRAALSLFTCRATAKKHGGDIRVESELGRGSTFTVLLPRSLEKMTEHPEGRA